MGYFQQKGVSYFKFSVFKILKLSVFKHQNFVIHFS